MKTKRALTILVLAAAIVCLQAAAADALATKKKPPQRIKSAAQLLKLLQRHHPSYAFGDASELNATGGPAPNVPSVTASTNGGSAPLTGSVAGANMAGGAGGGSASGDVPFSTTNVQVAGVDEGDIVKNDGEYIYQVNRSRVLVIHAYPETELSVKANLPMGSDFYPQELYLAGDRLIVIGSAWRSVAVPGEQDSWPTSTVKALVFDVSNKDAITQVREVEIDGGYLSSRRIDDYMYLIARKYPDYYALMKNVGIAMGGGGVVAPATLAASPSVGMTTAGPTVVTNAAVRTKTARRPKDTRKTITPAVRDTASGGTLKRLDVQSVFWFPDSYEPDYLIVAAFNIRNNDSAAQVGAFLGAGNEVYASENHLYVAASNYFAIRMLVPNAAATPAEKQATSDSTGIYKFELNKDQVTFQQRGDVPGTILNQYSMDEQNGYLRVATTKRNYTDWTTTNSLYVLGSDMTIAGSVEDIAPGEQIFASRFIGDRCYLVTFRQVDPLFVIDLTNPAAPAILGQLKVPGFSNYLHPYDDTHILGFGKDAVNGLYQGLKISLFDVSDVANPVEDFTVTIGDRGSTSDVLYDPKALLFDKAQNLLVLPVSVAQIVNKTADTPAWTWGQTVFVGAHVYSVTLDKGFVLRGVITHNGPSGVPDTGQTTGMGMPYYWYYGPDTNIRRSLFIGTDLYTLSDAKVKVNDLGDLSEKAALDLPAEDIAPGPVPLDGGGTVTK
ncbi:MAG TPA: beta-propeller domain-containing protein [Planctomycetota bacterium]|jgi:uncharacterized secreted protein with C-terminal beta-propeller domain